MDSLVLEVSHLDAWHRDDGGARRQALFDVSFDLHRGEALGLVGESGSGKSTLARSVLGFVRDYRGTVTHHTKLPQMIFQDVSASLNPARRIAWILEEPLRLCGGYTAADQADIIDVAVLPAYRRRGIARALMQAVIIAAAEHIIAG